MRWKEEAQRAKIGRAVIEGRLARLAANVNHPTITRESIEDYLSRGGKITKLQPKNK
jgi:hypothetical protein